MPEKSPELYQVLGAALRDIAQARFTSDVYSRQISFLYEEDPLLRRFPVPRVDVEEVELTLNFAVQEVAVDPTRHTSSNAAVGSLLGQYAVNIAREDLNQSRALLQKVADDTNAKAEDRAAAQGAIKRLFADEVLQNLSGRLLQYFHDTVEDMVIPSGNIDVDTVISDLEKNKVTALAALKPDEAAELQALWSHLNLPDAPRAWEARLRKSIQDMDGDIADVRGKCPDYNISVSFDIDTLKSLGGAVSSIRVKAAVKNYMWAKVDVDEDNLRHIRTLTPE